VYKLASSLSVFKLVFTLWFYKQTIFKKRKLQGIYIEKCPTYNAL